MKKIILCALMCAVTFMLMSCSCAKKEEIKYNDVEAKAEGTVTLDVKEPKIRISNIKAKKGADIDYLSGVVVENEDEYDDLKIWVDASAVDIYESGDYKAKYTFEYGGKSYKYEIIVTILDEEPEVSGEDAVWNPGNDAENNMGNNSEDGETQPGSGNDNSDFNQNNNENTDENNSGAGNENNQEEGDKQHAVENTDNGKKPTSVTKPSGGTEATTTKKNDSNSNSTSVTASSKPLSGGDNSTTQTTKREMITSSGPNTTQIKNIGYSYIELLSGSTVSIKSTTAKYIVSTRTDVSYTTKNNVKYKVSKLIITYNTGDERTLETVEEKCR